MWRCVKLCFRKKKRTKVEKRICIAGCVRRRASLGQCCVGELYTKMDYSFSGLLAQVLWKDKANMAFFSGERGETISLAQFSDKLGIRMAYSDE